MPSTSTVPRRACRAARVVGGWALVVSGAALLVLPGPGVPLVLGGLALLAQEHAWAGRLQRKILDRWSRVRQAVSIRRSADEPPP